MSKKKKHSATPPAPTATPSTASAAAAPTVGNPGDAANLPAAVTADPKGQMEKMGERDAIAMLETAKRELGTTGGTATLRRRNPSFGIPTMASLGMSVDAKDVTQEFLARTFGGGDFEIRFRTPDGNFDRTFTVPIDPTIPPKNPLAEAANRNGLREQPAVDLPAIVTALKDAMPRENNSGLMDVVKAALARPERDDTKLMLEMMKDQREEQRKSEERYREESRKSEERFMKMFEKLSERAAVPVKSFADQLHEITEVAEAIGLGRRGGKEEFAWGPVIEKGIDAAGKLMEAHLAGGAPEPKRVSPLIARDAQRSAAAPSATNGAAVDISSSPASPEATQGASTAAANGADAGEPNPEDKQMLQFALNRFRTQALEAARKGKDAYTWSLTTLAFVEENYANFLPTIFETTNAPDWFDRIFGADAAARSHVKFLTEVRETILLRAFYLHSKDWNKLGKTAEETAKQFIGWVHTDFHEPLHNATDFEAWKEFFEDAELPGAWLEDLRKAVEKTLAAEPDKPAAAEEKK